MLVQCLLFIKAMTLILYYHCKYIYVVNFRNKQDWKSNRLPNCYCLLIILLYHTITVIVKVSVLIDNRYYDK